jgi:hypothetical protein
MMMMNDIEVCPKLNTSSIGFKSWDSEWETKLIVDFLNTNRSIILLSRIESLAGISNKTLYHLLKHNFKTIHPETIKKLLPVLEMVGFKLKPRLDDDDFNVPIEEFKCELNSDEILDTDPQVDVNKIIYISKVVCSYFNVHYYMFQSVTRKREIVQARQIAIWFSKRLTKSSLATIGLQIGNKDHTTVLYACKTVNNLIETDKRFALQIYEIDLIVKKQITCQ